MKMICISANDNGSHDNQEIYDVDQFSFPIPDDWAVIPDDMDIPETFPFVSITTKEIGGVQIVTRMTAGIVPAPVPEPDPRPTELEQLRADVDFLAAMSAIEL